jgi:hypothetical protein
MAREAVAWLERHRDRPLFLNYWAFSVHAPFDAKADLVAKHRARVDPRQPQRSPTYAAMVESLDDAVGFVLAAWGVVAAAADLPRFQVPGCEAEMETLHRLHALHHDGVFSACTLWDGWLPQATLWASAEKRAVPGGAARQSDRRRSAAWFREVQGEGGYRTYSATPGRGTLQGGGTAGGLGLDEEFLESVLVPQVMLQGFLGFRATATGYEIHPRLPRDWPELTVSGIRFHDRLLTVTAYADGRVDVVDTGAAEGGPARCGRSPGPAPDQQVVPGAPRGVDARPFGRDGEPAAPHPGDEVGIVDGRPDGEAPAGHEGVPCAGQPGVGVEPGVGRVGQRGGAVVDVEEDRVEWRRAAGDDVGDVRDRDDDPGIVEEATGEAVGRVTVPGDHGRHELGDDHPGGVGEDLERRPQREPEAEPADDDARLPGEGQRRAGQRCQPLLGVVLPRRHQLDAAGPDEELPVMLVEREHGAIGCPCGVAEDGRFHGMVGGHHGARPGDAGIPGVREHSRG